MDLSVRMRALLAELAQQQGLPELSFDEDGLIPIRLDRRLEIAIGYSPRNDAVFLVGVVDPVPDPDRTDAWAILERNGPLAERRTRLAVDPKSRALILVRDAYLVDLEYYAFSAMLDEFVRDLEAQLAAASARVPPPGPAPMTAWDAENLLIFRP